MSLDLSKLTPAAEWEVLECGLHIGGSAGVMVCYDANAVEFCVLARNAFDGDPEALAWWATNRNRRANIEKEPANA